MSRLYIEMTELEYEEALRKKKAAASTENNLQRLAGLIAEAFIDEEHAPTEDGKYTLINQEKLNAALTLALQIIT